MVITHKKTRTFLFKIKASLFVLILFLGLVMHACSKGQIIVPKVTPEPTDLRLVGKFVWYDLFTNDLQSASRFYEGLFGWSFSDTASKEKVIKTISRDGVPIANAIHIDANKGNVNDCLWLSYMSVEDVDRALMVAKKNNGTIYMQPKDLPNRGRVAIVKDPEATLFAVVTTSNGDPPDQGLIQNHWMGSELWSKNPEAALKFYHLLAGYEQRLVDVGDGPKYRFLVKNGQTRGGIVKIPWDDVKPNWLPYIAVEDVMAIVSKAKKLGGRVLVEPDKTIREGRVAIISDPSGAVFAVQQF
ncbi:MAG: VOC family protein [Deltaproteobacteria bacterium]|nr:VOC family protein [Deltaproteobacteria bacterium]